MVTKAQRQNRQLKAAINRILVEADSSVPGYIVAYDQRLKEIARICREAKKAIDK
jgi:hypothetical protein